MTIKQRENVLNLSQWITNLGAVLALIWVSYQLVNARDSKAASNQKLEDRIVSLEKFESMNNCDHSEIKKDVKDIQHDIKLLLSRVK